MGARIFLNMGAAIAAAAASLASAAHGQASDPGLGSATLGGAAPWGNPIVDNRLYAHGLFTQLEGRFGEGSYLRWDGQAWVGNDYNKIWFKSEGRYNQDGNEKVSDGDTELLYDRPVSTYFNLQAGVRYDLDSSPERTWAALGVQGLAVGFWNVEATAYASDQGHYALKTNASYDYRLTQRLILQTQFETNWYTEADRQRQVGSGLSDIDSGVRLRYEFSRKFAPYVGVSYQRFFGSTAAQRLNAGSSRDDLRGLVGLRTWF